MQTAFDPLCTLKDINGGRIGAKDKGRGNEKTAGKSDRSKKSSIGETFASEAEADRVCSGSEQAALQNVLKLHTQVSKNSRFHKMLHVLFCNSQPTFRRTGKAFLVASCR